MSPDKEMTIHDFRMWLGRVDTHYLIDAEEEVRKVRERKKNEGQVSLISVEADGINVACFKSGDMKGVLEYLLAHAHDIDGEIRADVIRVPESEVAERLAGRWW